MDFGAYRNRFTLLLLLCICATGCKKYEEGPVIALRTVKQCLTGEWEMKRLLVDEIDETTALLAHPANCIYSIEYNGECKVCFDVKIQCQNETKYRDLYLENNKEGLSISGGNQFSQHMVPLGLIQCL